ncbi:MAG: cellulase family glycosylhydrolase [Spirochaetaceae bacterium]|jgi:hypothetical protein|nr:cellulase family glycosylhydrolase [Spirochaetaceae bacterium]
MHIQGRHIVDEQGRTLMLRGCNLGGSSKIPLTPSGETREPGSLADPAAVSFVGRPFPLEEAEAHFDRLKTRGFTFLRFIITWEALEHGGPGIYDEAYLAYLRKILLLAEEKGISVFLDPHQDVWSRWTGGDGAPAWTLEKLGMDPEKLDITGAALTHQHYGELRGGAPYHRMIWPTNYNRYAAATLFTIFFAGNTYTPETLIEGEPAQDWLQERYLACMRHCFRRLKNCKAIAGWGIMNEPNPGFIGLRDLGRLENPLVLMGPMLSPFEGMAAASGHLVEAPVYRMGIPKPRIVGREPVNPRGVSLFREGYECPWKKAGVWTDAGGEARLLRGDHFAANGGKPVNFTEDFLSPFMVRFIKRIREAEGRTIAFIEGIPTGVHPSWSGDKAPGVVNAFHWYDGATLFTRFFRPWFNVNTDTAKIILGRKKVAAYFRETLAKSIAWSRKHMGDIPCFLGEFGLPFDINGKKAYKTGDYRLHEEALSLYYDAIDANLLHSTIWTYTPDNTHETGDNWNGEDLSIYCKDPSLYRKDPGPGERALGGWLRPYPMATAGKPISVNWDRKKGLFRCRYEADGGLSAPTEIFAPPECLGEAPVLSLKTPTGEEAPGLRAEYLPAERRILVSNTGYTGEVILSVQRT